MLRASALTIALLLPFGQGCGPSEQAPSEGASERPLGLDGLEIPADVPPNEPVTEDEAPETTANEPQTEAVSPYQCVVPALPIPRPNACRQGRNYPRCKWQMPAAPLSQGRYRRWRNTIVEHWWGRPGLVSFLLASADAYEQVYPEQVLAIGDLDAPGPRHSTHDRGVDVDLYLLGAMLVENAGGGRYPNNHEGKSEEEIEELRQRVETLARILATCSGGQLRIYYNDDVVLERFHAWYDQQSFAENPFGRPMQKHNRLHDFHFHVTIPEDLPVLPREPLPEGVEDPPTRITAPPPPGSAPNLSSMNRGPGGWARVPRE